MIQYSQEETWSASTSLGMYKTLSQGDLDLYFVPHGVRSNSLKLVKCFDSLFLVYILDLTIRITNDGENPPRVS